MGPGGGAGGNILSSIMSQMDWQNPADSAMPYLQGLPSQILQYLQPYMNAGTSQIPGLQQQYGNLMNNPGGVVNSIGSQYQQSPGYQFQLQQAMNAGQRQGATTGMQGSPEMQQNMQSTATGLANNDYYNYLKNAMGAYGYGLQGAQGMFNQGAQTSDAYGTDIGNIGESEAQLAYAGQNAQNQQNSAFWSGIGNTASSFL